jgi:hypothetical protein
MEPEEAEQRADELENNPSANAPPAATGPVGLPPGVPTTTDSGEPVPQLPDPPTNGLPPAYPEMADMMQEPGWRLASAGSSYRYVGGDSSRILVGDRRSIVGGLSHTHVNGDRHRQAGGFIDRKFYSGRKTEATGPVITRINGGPQVRLIEGDQVRTTTGNQTSLVTQDRKVKCDGFRWESNLADRIDRWESHKTQEGTGARFENIYGVKNEVVTGLKSTLVVGMRFDGKMKQ